MGSEEGRTGVDTSPDTVEPSAVTVRALITKSTALVVRRQSIAVRDADERTRRAGRITRDGTAGRGMDRRLVLRVFVHTYCSTMSRFSI